MAKTKTKKRKVVKRKKHHRGNGGLLSIFAIMYKILPYLLIVLIVLFTGKMVMSLLLNSNYFKVKRIEILTNESPSASLAILKKLEVDKGGNVFRVDIAMCETAIEKVCPELKNVVVQRLLPDTLSVTYEVRKPICQVDSGYYYLVSDDLTILPDPQITQEPNLIIVTGINISAKALEPTKQSYKDGLKRAIAIIKEIEASNFSNNYEPIEKINIYDNSNPVLFLKDRTRVELGEFSFKEKEALLREIIDELSSKDKKARVIDLRFKDVVVIPR